MAQSIATAGTVTGTGGTDSSSCNNCGLFCRWIVKAIVVVVAALLFPVTAVVCAIREYKESRNKGESKNDSCCAALMAFSACMPFIGAGILFSYMTGENGGGKCAKITAFFSGLLILPALIGVGMLFVNKQKATGAEYTGCEVFEHSAMTLPVLGAGFLAKAYIEEAYND